MAVNKRTVGAANADAQVALIRKLREIRKANGIAVADVAESMGVDAAMVYRFEAGGTNFTAATLRKYAKAVGALLKLDAEHAVSDEELEGHRVTRRSFGGSGFSEKYTFNQGSLADNFADVQQEMSPWQGLDTVSVP